MSNELQTLIPTTLDEWFRFSELVSTTGLCPKDMRGKPADVLVAMQLGVGIGMAPMQAIQSIAVINGRPTLWGDAMLALVRQSGALISIAEEFNADKTVATCTVIRNGDANPVAREFSTAQAKTAGLAGKQGPWRTHPDRMLQLKARNMALRDVFPDVLAGMYMREDIAEIPTERDITPAPINALTKPRVTATETEAAIESQPEQSKPAASPSADAYKSTGDDADEFLQEIAMAKTQDKLTAIAKALKSCEFESEDDHDRLRKAYAARVKFIGRQENDSE